MRALKSNSLVGCIVSLTLTTLAVGQAPQSQPVPRSAGLRLGIVNEKPTTGISVVLPNDTYMIPYTATIPGTDVSFTMIPIRGGRFTMGSPDTELDRNSDEGPQFEVTIEPFWMGKHEVTWAEYNAFADLNFMFRRLQAKGKFLVTVGNEVDGVSAPTEPYEPSILYEYGEGPRQPAVVMTQFSAAQYTKFLSLITEFYYRLPTEAEWEYACRAGSTTAYHFGDDPRQLLPYGWFIENTLDGRHNVGGKLPNPWGLHDMHGNVAEWTLDQYSSTGYANVTEKSGPQPLTVTQACNRTGEPLPSVARGGGWLMAAKDCRSASRLASDDEAWKAYDPDFPRSPSWYTSEPANAVGFRIIRPLAEPDADAERRAAWEPANKEVLQDAKLQWDEGRGVRGVVTPSLSQEILEFRKLEK